MVCLRNMCIDTLHKGHNDDDDDDNINNNKLGAASHYNFVTCLFNTKFSAVYFLSFNPNFYIVNEILT